MILLNQLVMENVQKEVMELLMNPILQKTEELIDGKNNNIFFEDHP